MSLFYILSFSAFLLLAHSYYNNTETWMKDFYPKIYNRTLLEISLPGTHDSGINIFLFYLILE